jgi:uncharacterized RDD family membrane protein YckC
MKSIAYFFLSMVLVSVASPARAAENAGETTPAEKAPVAVVADAPATAPAAQPSDSVAEKEKPAAPEPSAQRSQRREKSFQHKLEVVFGEASLPAGKSVRDAEVVFSRGRIDGTVEGNAKFVFSDVTINGTVKGDIEAVFSHVRFGPDAVLEGEVKSVFSQVQRPGESRMTEESGGHFPNFVPDLPESLRVWGEKAFCRGRPLAIDWHLRWLWLGSVVVTALQLLLAFLFPRAVEACGRTLNEHPGTTVLASVAVMFGTPLVFLLLLLTGVGLLLWPFLIVLLVFAGIFGRTALQAVLGRPLAALFGGSGWNHLVVATAFGAVLLTLCFLVPYLGFLVWIVSGWLALGMIAATVVLNRRSQRDAEAAARAAAVPPTVVAPPPVASAAGVTPGVVATSPSAVSPVGIPATSLGIASLPRAGFWLRLAASFVDAIVIGIACGVSGLGHFSPLLFAAYCVVMWVLKGTTIGGIVFGLKVVRLDEQKIDWSIALVRALGGFLSLFVAGLGFFWVVIDRERQSWHDKIAGTTVVRVPKGVSLL